MVGPAKEKSESQILDTADFFNWFAVAYTMAGVYQFENIYHGPSAEIGSTCPHFNRAKLDFMVFGIQKCVWQTVAWLGKAPQKR